MGAVDIAVLIIVSVAVAAALGWLIYKKVKHKGGCDCGCSGCNNCSACKERKDSK